MSAAPASAYAECKAALEYKYAAYAAWGMTSPLEGTNFDDFARGPLHHRRQGVGEGRNPAVHRNCSGWTTSSCAASGRGWSRIRCWGRSGGWGRFSPGWDNISAAIDLSPRMLPGVYTSLIGASGIFDFKTIYVIGKRLCALCPVGLAVWRRGCRPIGLDALRPGHLTKPAGRHAGCGRRST